MHMRSLLLASSALACLPLFSPEGLGGGASVTSFQSYDPTGPNYVSGTVADALSAAGHIVVTEQPAPVVATLETSSVAQPVSLLPEPTGSDADRIAALEQRVAALEQGSGAKAAEVLAWAEKVLTKYYNRDADKPDVVGNIGDMANVG